MVFRPMRILTKHYLAALSLYLFGPLLYISYSTSP